MKSFTPSDLLLYRSVEAIDCKPGLDYAACTVRSPDQESNGYRSVIWLIPLDGGAPRQFTSGRGKDSSPKWSSDGALLAFSASRDSEHPQIQIISRHGGEAREVSHFRDGVVSFSWAPDGKTFAATAKIKVDPSAKGRRSAEPPQANAPQVVWRLPYKSDGIGYTLDREIHLFTVDAESGKETQLTDGPFDVRSADWSPDGKSIAYTRTRTGREAHRTDVWMINADGTGDRQLTENIASVQHPTWSPDGRWIAFAGSEQEGDSQTRLWLIEIASGSIRPLGDEAVEVESGASMCWSDDSSELVFIRVRNSIQEIASARVPGGEIRTIAGGERHVLNLTASSQRLVYSAASIGRPVEVYSCNWDGSGETVLTSLNAWWEDRALPRACLRAFDLPDGEGNTDKVDGWLILPPGNEPGPFPLLVDVHGGPHSIAFVEFFKHVYRHVLCAKGWAIIALNPVGSNSYGVEFARRIRGRWGDLDLNQHLAAVDLLQAEGLADERLAITGKSYGGYQAAWAITKTQRFKSAVISAPVSNIESHFGTSDSGYYVTPFAMCGETFIDHEKARRLAPMEKMHESRTPTLILQGTDDQRCPVGQSEEIFATIMRSSETPVEMILYPGGDHRLAEEGPPCFRVDYVSRLVDWVERWTNQPHTRTD
jgi:dipeptidyl aminopeptidase/acylaminoacyl peptidase